MTRAIGTATLAAIESDTANVIYFIEVEVDLTSSPQEVLRLHSHLGTITWDSKDWTGAGALLGLDSIQETNKPNPAPFRATLSGVNSAVTNIVYNTNHYRAPCKAYIGALSGGALVEDPSLFFSGFVERLSMVFGGKDGDSVQLTAESEFILFKRSRNVRYTDAQLQSEYSGDLGFQFLESTANSKVVWRGKRNRMGDRGAAGRDVARGVLRGASRF